MGEGQVGFLLERGIARGLKLLSKGEIKMLKNAGKDIHAIKGGVGNVARFDLFKDKTGEVFQLLKGGKGEPHPVDINIRNFKK